MIKTIPVRIRPNPEGPSAYTCLVDAFHIQFVLEGETPEKLFHEVKIRSLELMAEHLKAIFFHRDPLDPDPNDLYNQIEFVKDIQVAVQEPACTSDGAYSL